MKTLWSVLFIVALTVFVYFEGHAVEVQTTVDLGGDAAWYQLVERYWFHGLSLLISPLAGFAIGQYYKTSRPQKPPTGRTAFVAGATTAILASWLWPGDLQDSLKIGVTVGVIQPFIILVWFWTADRFAPKQAEELRGKNGDLTILPWVKMKNPATRETKRNT